MKDPERLGITGTDDDRRLLRSAQSVRVPDRIKDQVRRAVELRMHPRPRKRLLLAGAGLLVAATAAAAGLPPLLRAWQSPAPPPAQPAPPRPHPTIQPLPATDRPAPPAPTVAAHAPRPAPEPPQPAAPPPALAPELDLRGFLHPPVEASKPPPPPPPARLVIERNDRKPASLEATATTVRGFVRGRSVALSLVGRELSGHIGDDAVSIHIFLNREAHGHVGGRELHFSFHPTDRGWIVEASLPDVGGQVRVEPGALAFRPGCDRDLLPVAGRPGAYEGTCSDDTRLRVEVPATLLDPMARLVVLGMLLPEPEPMLRGQVPGLFPPP